MHIRKTLFFIIWACVFVSAFFAASVPANAATAIEQKRCSDFNKLFDFHPNDLNSSHSQVDTTSLTAEIPSFCSASDLLMYVMNLLLMFAGTVAVLFIIIGGFWYMTSAGNEEQAEKGKKTLINSVIGLAVIILAATIVRIVSNTLGGTTGGSGNGPATTQGGGNGPGNPQDGGVAKTLSGIVAVQADKTTVPQDQALNFTASFSKDNLSDVTKACGSNPLEFTARFIGSGKLKSANFTRNAGGKTYFANVTFGQNTLPPGNDTVEYQVCGIPFGSIAIGVEGGFKTVTDGNGNNSYASYDQCFADLSGNADNTNAPDPGKTCCAYFPQDSRCNGGVISGDSGTMARQAASRSSFTWSKNSSGDVVVAINASISDKMLMCQVASSSQLTNKRTTVEVNGKTLAYSAQDSSLTVESKNLPSGNLQFSVSICGNAINGG